MKKEKKIKNKLAFTLFETLIVISVFSLTLPLIYSIFYQILAQQIRIYQLSQLIRESNTILNKISTTINFYATSIFDSANEICKETTNNPILIDHFKDSDNNQFKFCLTNNGSSCDSGEWINIASISSIPNASVILNSSKVRLRNLNITCQRTNLFSPPLVNISFDICYYTNNNSCAYSLQYQTRVKLKKY